MMQTKPSRNPETSEVGRPSEENLNTNQPEMSFLDHLEELRWRIIKSAIALTVIAIPCGIYWQKIFDIVMLHPLRLSQSGPKLIY
ncbi:MAG: twin-arginine translocase subunit TatC, partial [Chitinivibrionales bacterium]|nr:twin-arginine translocase subunit TatC [Chitinivibrionales bacterium]